MAGLTPFAFNAGEACSSSVLRRIPSLLKLFFLLALSITAFQFFPFGGIFSLLFVIVAACTGKIPIPRLFGGSAFIFVMAAAGVFFRSISWEPPMGFYAEGFHEGVAFALGLVTVFALCALFFAVTTMSELQDSLKGAAQRIPILALSRAASRAALSLTLMLGFLPRFFEIWEAAETAYRARAGRNTPRKLVFLVALVTERMIEHAVETASALEMRGAGED